MMKKNLLFSIIAIVSLFCMWAVTHAQEDTHQNGRGVIDFNRIEELKGIQARHENSLLRVPGIVGIGIGLTEDGKDLAFIVYVEKRSATALASVPYTIEDVPVRVIESEMFRAY